MPITGNLEFFFQSSVETSSIVNKTVIDWNNGVDNLPVTPNEQIINVMQTYLQPVTQADWQSFVNTHIISMLVHCKPQHRPVNAQ